MIVLNSIYCYFDQIKKEKMGGACGLYGREDKYTQGCSRKLKKRDRLQELSVDDSILLKGT
jgi:hypothetical protein